MNPYSKDTFFSFFITLGKRIPSLISGKESLVSDEIQILALCLISVGACFLGAFLLLKKMTMLANSLSHTVLLGIVLCFLWLPKKEALLQGETFPLLIASFITALITTITTQFFTKTLKLQEEASTGLVFTFFFSTAILLVSLFLKNVHLGTMAVMGSLDILQKQDLEAFLPLLLLQLIFFPFLYRGLKVTTFDASFSCNVGFSSSLYHYFLMFLLSLTVVSAFRVVGVLLVIGLFVMPYLAVRIWCHSLKKILLFSLLFSWSVSCISIAFSRHLFSVYKAPVSSSGLVVVFLGFGYLLSFLVFSLGKRKSKSLFKQKKEL